MNQMTVMRKLSRWLLVNLFKLSCDQEVRRWQGVLPLAFPEAALVFQGFSQTTSGASGPKIRCKICTKVLVPGLVSANLSNSLVIIRWSLPTLPTYLKVIWLHYGEILSDFRLFSPSWLFLSCFSVQGFCVLSFLLKVKFRVCCTTSPSRWCLSFLGASSLGDGQKL